jgi:uncharacterized protein YjlB
MKKIFLFIIIALARIVTGQINNPTNPVLTYYDNTGANGGRVVLNSIQAFDNQGSSANGVFWEHVHNANYFDNLMRMTNENSIGSILVIVPNLSDLSYTKFKTVMQNRGWTVTGTNSLTNYSTVNQLNAFDIVIIGAGGSGGAGL